MKLHNNKDDKIKAEIQNLWNVVRERHLNVDIEWKTSDRTRKSSSVSKENEKPSQAHTSESDRGRGKSASASDRGSSTRGGRSASASGRGGRGSGGRSESRSNTRTKDIPTTIVVDNTNTSSWDPSAWNTNSATVPETSNGVYSKPATVGVAWKSTETFAERIKRQNAEAELAARLVQQEEAVSESLLAGDNDPLDANNSIYSDVSDDVAIELEASVAELTIDNSAISHVDEYNIDSSNIIQDPLDETHEEILSSVPANLISDQSLQQSVNINQSNEPEDSSNNDPAYLKMGRWAESSVAAPFQFGSFGKDISEEVQSSSWSNDIAVNDSSPDVWNGSNPSGLDISNNGQSGISNSLFNQSKPVSSDKYEQKPPPGFGGSIAPTRSTSKPDAVSQSPQSAPNIPYQYPAPPGISGNVRGGLPPGYPTPNPYYAPPGYDIPQAQYLPPYAPPAAQPPSSSQVSGSASTSNGTGSTPATNNSTGNPPQQPQQYAPYGYFGNPYYPNQGYYYSPQMPYYGQPRGIYQPPRGPYGGDPYGNPGPVYGDIYSGGVYPDASGYGGYPSAVTNPGPNPNGGKVPKGGVGSNASTNAPVADHNNNYGYLNHYNPRNDPQGWGYQQNPPVWQPMMAYSGVNPAAQSAPPSAGQTPASSAQQQQAQQQTQRPPANNYGANSFAGRNGNPTASGAGQTW
eukprot:gene17404-22953_t